MYIVSSFPINFRCDPDISPAGIPAKIDGNKLVAGFGDSEPIDLTPLGVIVNGTRPEVLQPVPGNDHVYNIRYVGMLARMGCYSASYPRCYSDVCIGFVAVNGEDCHPTEPPTVYLGYATAFRIREGPPISYIDVRFIGEDDMDTAFTGMQAGDHRRIRAKYEPLRPVTSDDWLIEFPEDVDIIADIRYLRGAIIETAPTLYILAENLDTNVYNIIRATARVLDVVAQPYKQILENYQGSLEKAFHSAHPASTTLRR